MSGSAVVASHPILDVPPVTPAAGEGRLVNNPDSAANAEKLERELLPSSRRTSGTTFAIASTNGAASVICEPMCICTPRIAMLGMSCGALINRRGRVQCDAKLVLVRPVEM